MTTTTETSGWTIFVITQDDEGPPNRRPIGPGNFIDGGWVDTDISAEADEVKAACAAAWTPEALAAYKAAFPWVEPVTVFPSTPALIAMGQMILTDGDVSSVTISAALAGAFMFDVGEFWVFFLDEQPDTNYMALAYDGGSVRAFVQDDEKATDHFVIRTTDFTGTPTNPPALNFEIKRVI